MISSIVAVDENWAIGCGGKMLFHLPADLAHFKNITSGKTVFMGRKTLESLPGGNPLPNRRNIVLTTNLNYKNDKVEIAHSFKDLFNMIKDEEAFNIGGGEIYRSLLEHSSRVYVTKIKRVGENADSFFPNLDKSSHWHLESVSEVVIDNGTEIQYCVYKRLEK